MKVKEASNQKLQPAKEKEEKNLPKRSFKEVMRGNEKPKGSQEEEEKVPLPSPMQVALVAERSSKVSHIETLSIEFSPLVEEMANYIKIESDKGISTTTVEVALEGSIFDGAEVVIKHYDTDPHSFNLQLAGSPEAVDVFAVELKVLQDQLQTHEALKGFHIRIETPILSLKSGQRERGKERLKRVYSPKIVNGKKKMTS